MNIKGANDFLTSIKNKIQSTHGPNITPGKEYAGIIEVNGLKLAATCDGVGTKILIAEEMGQYEGIGQDLVAMSVNDLLAVGATPLFFLDYMSVGKINPSKMESIITGIVNACNLSGCALLGGETAGNLSSSWITLHLGVLMSTRQQLL